MTKSLVVAYQAMRYAIAFTILLLSLKCFSQQSSDSTTICANPEIPPTFPGGMDSLMRYAKKNPIWTHQHEPLTDKIIVEFIVESDGSISNVKIVKGTQNQQQHLIIQFFTNMPKWRPGSMKVVPTRTKMVFPFWIHYN